MTSLLANRGLTNCATKSRVQDYFKKKKKRFATEGEKEGKKRETSDDFVISDVRSLTLAFDVSNIFIIIEFSSKGENKIK